MAGQVHALRGYYTALHLRLVAADVSVEGGGHAEGRVAVGALVGVLVGHPLGTLALVSRVARRLVRL